MTTLFDHLGRPVNTGQLKREEAGASITSVRTPWDDMVATGMTPAKVVAFLQAASRGDHETYVKFAADMERRDPHYYSVMQTRKLAVAQLDRKVESPSDDPEDVKIAEMLTGVVNGEGFTRVIQNVLDALGKGFSINEIIWDTELNEGRLWLPKEIKWRNPKFFKPHPDTGDEWLLRDNSNVNGIPLSPFKYIIHEPHLISGLPVAAGLARVCIAMHMFKSFGLKSWMAFAEVFGMPLRIGKYPIGADTKDIDTLKRALADIGADAAAVIPTGMEIIIERAGESGTQGGDDFFMALAGFMNAEMSKAVLGQTMTVEDGSSQAQANIHNEVRKDLRDGDAESLEDTLNRYLLRPIVDLNFGPRPRPQDYPRVVLDKEEPEDLVALAAALVPFIGVGLPVEVSPILDKFGLDLPEAGALLLALPAPPEVDKDEGDGGDEENSLVLSATLAKIVAASSGSTNHRDFQAKLKEILISATRK